MRPLFVVLLVLLLASPVRGKAYLAPEHRVANIGSCCWWAAADTIGRATNNRRLAGILQRVVQQGREAELDGSLPSEVHNRLSVERIPVNVSHRIDFAFLQWHVKQHVPLLATIFLDPARETSHAVVITDLVWVWDGKAWQLMVELVDPNLPGDQRIPWAQFQALAVPIIYTFPAVR